MVEKKREIEFNSFFFDATSFISKANELIKPKMSDNEAILALLLSSIGFEKILKGILFNVNPLFICPKPKFEESSEALYSDLFVDQKESKHLTDLETISFTTAIQRAKVFSKTVLSHVGLLYKLADTRNTIAHNICAIIDRNFIRPFLLKEFKLLIKEFNNELRYKKDTFFKALPWIISLYVEEKEEPEKDLADEIIEKLEKHKSIWKSRETNTSFIENKSLSTNKLVQKGKSIIITCPACDNDSVLFYEPDFDYSDGQAWFTGLYVSELECLFCDLNIRDYDEIDYLRFNDHLLNQFGNEFKS